MTPKSFSYQPRTYLSRYTYLSVFTAWIKIDNRNCLRQLLCSPRSLVEKTKSHLDPRTSSTSDLISSYLYRLMPSFSIMKIFDLLLNLPSSSFLNRDALGLDLWVFFGFCVLLASFFAVFVLCWSDRWYSFTFFVLWIVPLFSPVHPRLCWVVCTCIGNDGAHLRQAVRPPVCQGDADPNDRVWCRR